MKPYGFLGVGIAAGFVVGALAMNMANSSNANAAAGTASKTEIEAVVKDYIAANGEALLESIESATQRAQNEKIAALVNGDSPSKGPATAPVTIVEFSDFQCPFCDRVQESINEVRAKYGDNVRWVYKNLPLDFHPEAKPSAYASLAAHKQGKFWEYSEQLWAKQAQLGEKTYVDIAQSLKLDMTKFNKDRASDEVKEQVETDLTDAQNVGARGTPHFMINGESMSGALPAAAFGKIIDAELAKAKK